MECGLSSGLITVLPNINKNDLASSFSLALNSPIISLKVLYYRKINEKINRNSHQMPTLFTIDLPLKI